MLGDYPQFKYILTLQESVAVGMGEAYARATQKPSFVSLHVDSGLANGIALMLDAYNTGTPMVVTSANYDARKVNETKTDLAELVRPVTKWAVELSHADQIPSVMRRAFNEANSHPKGPVYVGFTSNALEGMAEMNIVPSSKIHDATRPDPNGIREAAALLDRIERAHHDGGRPGIGRRRHRPCSRACRAARSTRLRLPRGGSCIPHDPPAVLWHPLPARRRRSGDPQGG